MIEAIKDIVGEDHKTAQALDMIIKCGFFDGAHHKDWVLDQVVAILAGDRYDQLVAWACAGEDGPDTYPWFEGTAP